MITDDIVTPTPYQDIVMHVPEQFNLLLAGGRGGGKSYGALLLMLRHVEQYGSHARPLLIRETHKALLEAEEQFDTLLGLAYQGGVRHNRGDHVFRLPNGAVIEFGQLDDPTSYKKYQGRSFTLLIVEEFGAMKDASRVALLRSNLRAPESVPLRTILTANPGGALHTFIHTNYIARSMAWHPFKLDSEQWVMCPSTYIDNPHIDHADYERKLRAACGSDEALLKAWLTGDWNIAKGAFFGDLLSPDVHMLDDLWNHKPRGWRSFIAGDWGFSAPSVVYFCVQPREHIGHVAAHSLVLLDEVSTAHANDFNKGMGWPPGKLAEAIHEKCKALNVSREGVFDDYRGLDDTLISEFRRLGVFVQRPQKQRIGGWGRMRELLHNAKEQNGRPGLYIAKRCRYFWATVPFLPRDELRPEDVDTNAPDHAADAARYAVLHSQFKIGVGKTVGMW